MVVWGGLINGWEKKRSERPRTKGKINSIWMHSFKNIYFCVIDYAKAFDCVDHNKLWKILKEMGIPDHLTCLLRNLSAGQKATVRNEHGKMDWFKIGKGICQDCILSPCLFNLHAEYIMWNAGLDEAQARIKIAERNINNLRYADNTTLMGESEEELRSLLMRVKEESERACLKLNIQKTKITASGPSLHGKQMRTKWKQWETLFSWAPKSLRMLTTAMKLVVHWKKSYDQPRQHVKKQRCCFADKSLYSQSYGLSGSHAPMSELDHIEGWVLKNWCFQTGVGEDSWESLGQQGDLISQS